jgi:hypothetical protein
MKINEENKKLYEKMLKKVSNSEDTFLSTHDINTGFVGGEAMQKLLCGLPSKLNKKKKRILVFSDYGEFVSELKCKYGDNCEIYCVPTTYYGYVMCKMSLSVYVNNPENFVIFDMTKLRELRFRDEYLNYIMKCKNMKFDIIVGNPPFEGGGKPLFMQIVKIIYENYLNDGGLIRVVHPTTLIDNKFNLNIYNDYKDIKVISFDFSNELRDMFIGAEIGNGIGIFTYGKEGKYDLLGDELKAIRFGNDYYKDKEIVETILSNCEQTIGYHPNYKYIGSEKNKESKIEELNSKYNVFVSFSRNRGHIDKKTGGLKWDWTTLLPEKRLKVLDKLDNVGQNVIHFNSKKEGFEYIKWSITDVVNFIVLFYKNNLTNSSSLFKHIPQPIPSGDYSDESIMKHFGLSKEQMEYIHNKVNKYGIKIYYKCSEKKLLQKIDEMMIDIK